MNKKTLNVVSLIAGCMAAAMALFYVIYAIITLTRFESEAGAKYNILIALYSVVYIAAAALLTVIGIFVVKDYVNKKEEKPSRLIYAGFVYFALVAIFNLLAICFFNGGEARNWVMLIIGVAGAILGIIIEIAKFEGNVKAILCMVFAAIGFVVAVVGLINTDTLGVFYGLFTMALFVCTFLYFLFGLLIASGANNKPEDVEAKEEKAE